MLKAEQIPDEVVEAAARAYAVANDTPELWWRLYEEKSRAALLAGLKAWEEGYLILPLRKENTSD